MSKSRTTRGSNLFHNEAPFLYADYDGMERHDEAIFTKRVPAFIPENLKHEARPYQLEAFGRFDYYWHHTRGKAGYPMPTEVLFHMATGSGKTYIMAGLMLYLYEKGYRQFLFFVNSTSILQKTIENFTNAFSSKYLFKEKLILNGKTLNIRVVENFESDNRDDLQICFTTIQGLHSNLNTPKENSITYEDFEGKSIVLISDEAHHLNALTKGRQTTPSEEERTWEGTVRRILACNTDNVLLEFTATAETGNENIRKAYLNKIIFDYSLKSFKDAGYSKEIKVFQSTLEPFERALLAVLMSQYRRKLFEEHRLAVKPVILFKSKTIPESQNFFKEFLQKLKDLKPETIQRIQTLTDKDDRISQIFLYLDRKGINFENLILELKEDFSEEKCISVNSKEESENKQIAVNTLEDYTNEYRAIFAVDKLNEGWDVLNLFDIVRLYDTKNPKTTVAEAQLIGRGARYFPFSLPEGEDDKYIRKFDGDFENDLRVCEELYYHTLHDPEYVRLLEKNLVEIGLMTDDRIEINMKLKESFKQSDLYKSGLLWVNELVSLTAEHQLFIHQENLFDKTATVNINRNLTGTITVLNESTLSDFDSTNRRSINFTLKEFPSSLIRKGINQSKDYRFNRLKEFLPSLSTVTALLNQREYLKNYQLTVTITGEDVFSDLNNEEKLHCINAILEHFYAKISKDVIHKVGSQTFKPASLHQLIQNKKLSLAKPSVGEEKGKSQSKESASAYRIDLSNQDWYAFEDEYGTSEEKALVMFFNEKQSEIKRRYDKFYLIRNERFFKLYDFKQGRAFEPDYVLYLQKINGETNHWIQVFIEPKGDFLVSNDQWKEDFLLALLEKADLSTDFKFENQTYKLLGFPFFNIGNKKHQFIMAFDNLIN